MGNTKGQYVVPANTTFSIALPVEGGGLFLPAVERLQTLHPGAYARGTTSTSDGAKNLDLDVKLSARTHPGAAGLDSFPGGSDLSPTRPSSLVGAPIDLSPVTLKTWRDGGSAYGGQGKFDVSALAEAEFDQG